jgi:hypothetical protein
MRFMKRKAVKTVYRGLDSPYTDVGPRLREIRRHMQPTFSEIDATFAEPPETLESLIETLLPRAKRNHTRVVE